MIIDVHTHLGRNGNINARVDELLRSMDAAGIEKSLVFAGSISGCPTYEMLKEIKPHTDRLYGVVAAEIGSLYPNGIFNWNYFDKFNEQLAHDNVVAAKFYLGYEHFYPDDAAVSQLMDCILVIVIAELRLQS